MVVRSSFSWRACAGCALPLLAAFAPLACSESLPQVHSNDAGESEAGVDLVALAQETDISACAPFPESGRANVVLSSIESYCAARERAGESPCPKARRDVLSQLNDLCAGPISASLSSVCGVDELVVRFSTDGRGWVYWYFSPTTGKLVGAEAWASASMGCGDAIVSAGASRRSLVRRSLCNTVRDIPGNCGTLCFAPPSDCPADILAELPPAPSCGEPPPFTHEQCTEDEAEKIGGGDLQCGTSSCSAFSSGTCGGTCQCHRRGRYEWNAWCTE